MAKQRRKPTPPAKSRSSNTTAKPVAARSRVTPGRELARRSGRPASPTPKASTRKASVMPARRIAKTVVTAVAKTRQKTALKPVRPVAPPPPQPPVRRSTYAEAVALYQRGMEALQAHRYREAAQSLNSVITRYPEEKELHERAFLYLRVCERRIAATPSRPETPEERTFAATLALNNGAIDQAMALLATVLAEDPENDQATYMLGVANALKGKPDVALQYLSRALALNPENRDVARKDPDLEPLRRTESMRLLLASPPTPLPRKDKRVAPRVKGR
jgi:Tfp pilus assembly protein PilF